MNKILFLLLALAQITSLHSARIIKGYEYDDGALGDIEYEYHKSTKNKKNFEKYAKKLLDYYSNYEPSVKYILFYPQTPTHRPFKTKEEFARYFDGFEHVTSNISDYFASKRYRNILLKIN